MINSNVAIRKLLINTLLVSVLDGGKGSGFFGYKGRKGKVGGSAATSNTLSNPLNHQQVAELLKDEAIVKQFGNYSSVFKRLSLNNNGVVARINRVIEGGQGIFKNQEDRDKADELLETLEKEAIDSPEVYETKQYKDLKRAIGQDDYLVELYELAEQKFGDGEKEGEQKEGEQKEGEQLVNNKEPIIDDKNKIAKVKNHRTQLELLDNPNSAQRALSLVNKFVDKDKVDIADIIKSSNDKELSNKEIQQIGKDFMNRALGEFDYYGRIKREVAEELKKDIDKIDYNKIVEGAFNDLYYRLSPLIEQKITDTIDLDFNGLQREQYESFIEARNKLSDYLSSIKNTDTIKDTQYSNILTNAITYSIGSIIDGSIPNKLDLLKEFDNIDIDKISSKEEWQDIANKVQQVYLMNRRKDFNIDIYTKADDIIDITYSNDKESNEQINKLLDSLTDYNTEAGGQLNIMKDAFNNILFSQKKLDNYSKKLLSNRNKILESIDNVYNEFKSPALTELKEQIEQLEEDDIKRINTLIGNLDWKDNGLLDYVGQYEANEKGDLTLALRHLSDNIDDMEPLDSFIEAMRLSLLSDYMKAGDNIDNQEAFFKSIGNPTQRGINIEEAISKLPQDNKQIAGSGSNIIKEFGDSSLQAILDRNSSPAQNEFINGIKSVLNKLDENKIKDIISNNVDIKVLNKYFNSAKQYASLNENGKEYQLWKAIDDIFGEDMNKADKITEDRAVMAAYYSSIVKKMGEDLINEKPLKDSYKEIGISFSKVNKAGRARLSIISRDNVEQTAKNMLPNLIKDKKYIIDNLPKANDIKTELVIKNIKQQIAQLTDKDIEEAMNSEQPIVPNNDQIKKMLQTADSRTNDDYIGNLLLTLPFTDFDNLNKEQILNNYVNLSIGVKAFENKLNGGSDKDLYDSLGLPYKIADNAIETTNSYGVKSSLLASPIKNERIVDSYNEIRDKADIDCKVANSKVINNFDKQYKQQANEKEEAGYYNEVKATIDKNCKAASKRLGQILPELKDKQWYYIADNKEPISKCKGVKLRAGESWQVSSSSNKWNGSYIVDLQKFLNNKTNEMPAEPQQSLDGDLAGLITDFFSCMTFGGDNYTPAAEGNNIGIGNLIRVIAANAPKYHKPLWRFEDISDKYRDYDNIKVGDTINMNAQHFSCNEGFAMETASQWFGQKNPCLFEIQGGCPFFNLEPYTKGKRANEFEGLVAGFLKVKSIEENCKNKNIRRPFKKIVLEYDWDALSNYLKMNVKQFAYRQGLYNEQGK